MYIVGELVLYGVHGVCKIIEQQVQKIDRKNVEYFVLEPVLQPGTRFFVPSQNEAALAKLRPILSRPEVDELLASCAGMEAHWIEDENRRKLYYKELINSGDRAAMISVLRGLREHKMLQMESGKKFHITDANFMRDAEKIIYSELSIVLEIPYDQAEQYI